MATTNPTLLNVGDAAPAVHLQTDTGDWFDLAAHQGRNVVLYFYPKADTPGCTTEACEFRDSFPRFAAGDAVVAGLSPDEVADQAKFKRKYGLNFPLLADVGHHIAETYGVWKEKNMYGKKHMGIERTTFIVAKDGRIARIFRKVKPAGHAAEVLAALAELR